MNRYALIDDASGFVWGVCFADDPVTACRLVDEGIGEHDRDYEDIGNARLDGRSGYHVHIVPADMIIDDGQDADQIEAVSQSPFACRVVIHWTDPTEK
jgi:hypothetical protein